MGRSRIHRFILILTMEVFYQEIVTVNGKVFTLHTCDYSETVKEWIADGLVAIIAAVELTVLWS